ncbi:MAG: apolipoprotein N-acyltransferase [Sneathiella sp.]
MTTSKGGVLLRLSDLHYWKRAALAFCLGLLLATSFAPLHFVFVLPVCFSGALILLSTAKTRWQAFFIGWWFGWGQFMAGLYWIGVAFTIDANAHAALLPIPVMGLPAFLAIFPGLVALVTHYSGVKGVNRVFLFTALWVLADYGRGIIFTGFPWNLTGYAWGNILPMLQWSAYVGIYGLTLLTVLISSIPALLAEPEFPQARKNAAILSACGLLAGMVVTGYVRLGNELLAAIPGSQIRIVQPNIRQADKWRPELKFSHVRTLTELSAQPGEAPPRYLVWPETAVPFFLTTDKNLQFYLQRFIPASGALITGAPRKNTEAKQYWNSIQVLDPDGKIPSIYDKQHLVPYGEYLPLQSFLKASGLASLIPVLDQMSSFTAGTNSAGAELLVPGLPPARALICYEIAFPWEVQTHSKTDWILNATNDGWFGNTSGPFQHFIIARTRAIEQGKSVVRAANTGISAIIDGYGRVTDKLPLNSQGILDGTIPKPLSGQTLYQRGGEYLPLGLVFLLTGLALFRHRQNGI